MRVLLIICCLSTGGPGMNTVVVPPTSSGRPGGPGGPLSPGSPCMTSENI